MELWLPTAIKVPLPDAGRFLDGPYRIVLHSTEGNSYAGALAAYRSSGNSPHFTASFEGGKFQAWQHVPLDRAASALEHRTNTVQTNRQSAVQIEVVAFAAKPNWPQGLVDGVGGLLAWIAAQTGVKAVTPDWLPYPQSYGQTRVRMSPATWLAFNGVCGHEHVCNQSHGDPGAIPIAALLAHIAPPAPPTPKEAPTVAVNSPPVALLTHPTWGDDSYIVICADGGVFNFGKAPFEGSLGGIQLAAPVVAAGVTSTGLGYWLLARDGGMFAEGDARFSGKVEYTG